MPTFPVAATPVESRSLTLRLVDIAGTTATTSLSGLPSDITTVQRDAFRDAVGGASNAGMLATKWSQNAQISVTQTTAYDEGESSATIKGIFVFQNSALDQVSVSVPAPDESLFAADGKTIDPTNTQAAAVISATLALLNTTESAEDYGFVRGFKSDGRSRTPYRAKPLIVEPPAGAEPPPEPGT